MFKARIPFPMTTSSLALIALLAIATTPTTIKAGTNSDTATINVPGRYVSGQKPSSKNAKISNKPVPATAVTADIAPSNVEGRYVAGKAGKAGMNVSSRGVSSRYVPEPKSNKAASETTKPLPGTNRQANLETGVPSSPSSSFSMGHEAIRQALANLKSITTKRINRHDADAVRAFYENRNKPPLWVSKNGLTSRGKAVSSEIARADDWGLSAKAFDLPGSINSQASPQERAKAELKISLSVLKYIRFARGGRVNPPSISHFLDQKPQLMDPKAILPEIENATAPDAFLRHQHPTHPQFAKLQKALIALLHPKKAKAQPVSATKKQEPKIRLPDGPTLRPGMSHPQVALLRQRLKVAPTASDENKYDAPLKTALEKFQSEHGLRPDGIVGPMTRRILNGGRKVARRKPASMKARIQKIIINMERWRWMPRDPGAFYVLNNIPEYRTRVYKKDHIIYSEKIIVGKNKNPTPTFSADMKLVVFHPSWGVPNGIKKTEILPYLRQSAGLFGWGGADTRILTQHNLKVTYRGKPIDASKVNWSQVDIRNYDFVQAPSSTNVLGKVKFRFPNRHDVYMHDTPERNLFKSSKRNFSHGCMRVNKPRRLAEVILKEDKGWTSQKVGRYWAGGGTVKLDKPIPVHTAYFTAFVEENGKVKTFSDVYGYDGRVARALGRRPMSFEPDAVASSSNSDRSPARRSRAYKKKKQSSPPATISDLFANLLTP